MARQKKWRDHSNTGWIARNGRLLSRGKRMTSPNAKKMRKKRRQMARASRRRNRQCR